MLLELAGELLEELAGAEELELVGTEALEDGALSALLESGSLLEELAPSSLLSGALSLLELAVLSATLDEDCGTSSSVIMSRCSMYSPFSA